MKDNPALRAHLSEAYRRNHETTESGFAEHQNEFVFHMLDAQDDLVAYARLLSNPDGHTPDEAHQIVQALLLHAAGHLVAAARLYDVFLDTFEGKESQG
jgi:hypothetical protein